MNPPDANNPFGPVMAWIEAKIGADLGSRLAKVEATIDETKVRALCAEALQQAIDSGKVTRVVEVSTPTAVLKVNGTHHPILDELLERYARGARTFLLVGPAGTGKTTIAEQFMRAIGAVRYSVIPCSEDKRAAEYIGWRNAINDQYVPTALVDDLCASGIWSGSDVSGTIIEEMDASGANVLLTLNTLTNGYLATPDAGLPMCPRGPEHVIIATANTYGNAGSLTYVGRNQLDGATTNRYRKLFVGYDRNLEIAITGSVEIVDHATKVRANMERLKMKRIWGTRDLVRMKEDTEMSFNKGKSLDEIFRTLAQNEGWSADEITRALA